jgi:tetratricopeptide (TPR) repeat protein
MTDNQREPSACLVYCLSVDLIGSTDAGMKLSTRGLGSFNMSLVEQIKPHLENLELTDALVKFTGDGWLLMTDKVDRVPALCCLSIIMANRFQDEMSRKTGIAIDKIPPLRTAICAGIDLRVRLPDKRTDWVGDSARRAVRASGYCSPNEILIAGTIRDIVFRDFATKLVDLEQRQQQPKKTEEIFPLHVLGEVNPEVAADSEAPGYFVYTLDTIGKKEEAAAVAQQGEERLIDAATKLSTSKKEIPQEILRKWNRLISNIGDYSTALEMLRGGQAVGFAPDVVTYNTLISKAPDYDEAKGWVGAMLQDDIQPDVVTYNTLISKAPDYDEAKGWVETMLQDGVLPNVVTYSTLIFKAPDYDEAKGWVETMLQDGVLPNVVTYSTLFGKDLSGKSADEIISWYLAQAYHPEKPIQIAIATYRKSHHIDQALRLALDYPHTEAARKVMRENVWEALTYFSNISKRDPNHPRPGGSTVFRERIGTG